MKKFLSEFKAFITRGNILDMAVGVIVGGAFNTIVTTLNKQILMPVINYILSFIPGMESGLYTILPNSQLLPVGSTDTAILGPDGKSYAVLNYIDWTAFIESIFNFFFIALTLFIIIKVVAYLSKKRQELEDRIKSEIQEDEAPVEEEPILEPEPIKDPVVCLLEEIRDSLKKE